VLASSTRTVSGAILLTYRFTANISNLVSGQLYPSQQGPRYIPGNSISAGLTIVAGFLYASCWLLLRRRNAKKAKMIAEGASTNGKEGDQSLDFTYIL
jgi:hypothetical protein